MFVAAAAVALAFGSPALAQATPFKGSVDFWGPITITVSGNAVTGITGHSGAVKCVSGTSVGGVDMKLMQPVPIVNGRFHAEGSGATTGWGTPTTWSVAGSISIRRLITGTVGATAQTPSGEVCKGTFVMSAVVAPRSAKSPSTAMYMKLEPSAASVQFDYRHGLLTHLVVVALITCSSGSSYSANLDSVSYRLDPIQVNRGRFRLATDVLDGYGVVVHVAMTGTITGRNAAGAISASRGQDLGRGVETCRMHGSWHSQIPSTAPAPPVAPSVGAFYDVTPYRYGRPGAWTYYLMVRPNSCAGGVVAVRFTVAGATKTVNCNTKAKLGPISPQQTYRVVAYAIRRDGSAVKLADATLYVPGDDGNWVKVR